MLTPGTHVTSQVKATVLEAYDVVVAGGGTAGVVAALAAARNGAKTILVENSGFLGGMLTGGNAGITMFTKFSGRPEEHERDVKALADSPDELQIAGGIPMEIARRLLEAKCAIGNEGTAGAYIFTSSETFKRILFNMMEEAGVRVRLHSMLVDVIKNGRDIEGVVIESKSGREIIPAKQFIDATGDGDLCVRAGADYTVGVTAADLCATTENIGKMHPMGVMFKVGNVDVDRLFVHLAQHPEHFEKQPFARFTYEECLERYSKGEMATFNIRRIGEYPPHFQVYILPDKGVVTLCCPSVNDMDGCNADDLSRAEIIMANMLERWMPGVRCIPGFENAFLLQVPEMGVRETRHIQGDYVLDIEDIYHQRDFQDCIGFGAHPVDTTPRPAWLKDPETSYPPRWFFQIPFQALIVKALDNALVTGRCMSATHEAFGCIRPTVQCMITGEAAGTAAALAVASNCCLRNLPAEQLRQKLKENGVRC